MYHEGTVVHLGITPSAEGVIYDNPYFGVIHPLIINTLFLKCSCDTGFLLWVKTKTSKYQNRIDLTMIEFVLTSNQLNNDIQLLLYDYFVKTK